MKNDHTFSSELDDALNSYAITVKFWSPDMCDTFLTIGTREFLQKHLTDLSKSQKQILDENDKQVLIFAASEYEIETEDVEDIRRIADIINGKPNYKTTHCLPSAAQ